MKSGLILGLDGAGKTLLLRRLSVLLNRNHRSFIDKLRFITRQKPSISSQYTDGVNGTEGHGIQSKTQPTIGVEHTSLVVDARPCSICEVGGQLLPMWRAYFDKCDFWVYVVDIANATQLPGAVVELFGILRNEEMRRKPKLLLLNKMDSFSTLDDQLLRTYLCLDRLTKDPACAREQQMTIIKVSALTGENIEAVIYWLAQTLSISTNIGGPGSPTQASAEKSRGNDSTKNRVEPEVGSSQ